VAQLSSFGILSSMRRQRITPRREPGALLLCLVVMLMLIGTTTSAEAEAISFVISGRMILIGATVLIAILVLVVSGFLKRR
jgi:hypothetical protein